MNTMQAKMPRLMEAFAVPPTPWPARAAERGKAQLEQPAKSFQLTAEESARFVRIVSDCGRIRRHYDLFRWLSGELQQFLPHEILLSAWGDFANWNLKLDLASDIAGVRTAQLAQCRLDSLVREAYGRWLDAGRQAVLLKPTDLQAARSDCECLIHAGFRDMRSLLVHGVQDKRSGQDSLFIAFTSGSFTKGRSVTRFLSGLDPLVAQIDTAFRQVASYQLDVRPAPSRANALDLSARETEVLEALCRGRTNLEIAAALSISPFTVKNHVQRIFRKIGVTNRTQAAARYAEALLHAAVSNVARAKEALQKAG
jgi:transcriptional regulator EpsA